VLLKLRETEFQFWNAYTKQGGMETQNTAYLFHTVSVFSSVIYTVFGNASNFKACSQHSWMKTS
jgi:hypothetical protein